MKDKGLNYQAFIQKPLKQSQWVLESRIHFLQQLNQGGNYGYFARELLRYLGLHD